MDSSNMEEKEVCEVFLEPGSNKSGEKKWWHIDKTMIRFKIHYFLMTGGLGVIIPFIPVYIKNDLKMSATAYASVLLFQQFLNVVTTPLISYITDYFNRLKTVIFILAIFQSAFLLAFFLLPAIPNQTVGRAIDGNVDIFFDPSEICDKCVQLKNSQMELEPSLSEEEQSGIVLVDSGESYCSFYKKNDSNWKYEFPYTVRSTTCSPFQNNSFPANFILNNLQSTPDLQQNPAGGSNQNLSSLECDFVSEESCAIFFSECVICCKNETNCFLPNPIDVAATSVEKHINLSETSDFQTYQFWMFALSYVLYHASLNAIFLLSDTACCELIQKCNADFGKQRLWGAVGWGVFAAIGGFLNDYTTHYYAAWIVCVFMYTLMLWNISRLQLDKPHFSKDILKNIGTVMSSKEFLCIEVGVLMNGIGLGFIWFYLLWFLASIGGDGLVCGLVQTIQCFGGEIPFMFISGWVLRKIGYFNVLSLALLSYSVRFLWYSQLQDPWMVLPIEWTNGITYGLVHASLATYAKMKAKPGTETTTQSVVFATLEGLGTGIGNIIAGLCFDYLGGHQTFFYNSIVFGFFTVISIGLMLCNRTKVENFREISANHVS